MGRWSDAGVTLEGFFRAGIGFSLIPVRSQAKSTRPRLHHHTGTTSEALSRPAPTRGMELLDRRAKHPRVCPSSETPADVDKVSYAHTLPQDVTASNYAMREKKAFHPFVSHE